MPTYFWNANDVQAPPYRRGLLLATNWNALIRAAYRAGLRDGQVVVRRSPVYVGDATKPIELTIREGAGERTVSYYPDSRNTVGVPPFKLRRGIIDSERAETLRWSGVVASGG